MKKALLLILLLQIPLSPVAAQQYRVISSDEGGVTVEFIPGTPLISPVGKVPDGAIARINFPGYTPERIEGRPVLPVKRFVFEVPATRGIRLQVVEKDLSPVEDILPEVWFGRDAGVEDLLKALSSPPGEEWRDFAVLAGVETYRKKDVALVDIYPAVFDWKSGKLVLATRIVVRLSFPPGPPGGSNDRKHGLDDRFIVNSAQASTWKRRGVVNKPGQRTPFEFYYGDRWLKLKVSSDGIYKVSYNDLLSSGINPVDVDPAELRLFSGGPLQQPDSIDMGGSFEEDYHLTEHSILYVGANSGSFLPGESIIFYGLGVNGWSNKLDPSLDKKAYHKHRYATSNVYFLSLGGFPGTGARMEVRDVSPGAGPFDIEVTTYEERIHAESDTEYDPMYTDDFWFWRYLGTNVTTFTDFQTLSAVAGGGGMVRTLGCSRYDKDHRSNSATYYLNGAEVGSLSWDTGSSFDPDTLEVNVANIVSGTNSFKAIKPLSNVMYILWYEIYYDRYLQAAGGAIDFFSPSAAGTAEFEMTGFPAEDLTLLDVTNHAEPVLLSGAEAVSGTVRFEDILSGQARHYAAASLSALKTPAIETVSTTAGDLPSLRDDPVGPHMVIIYNSRFMGGANTLRNYHSTNLPFIASPVVKAVDVEDVYDNFSGGMKDPLAIRNYLKFLYDNFTDGGEPVLTYVLLVGNGTYDPRNILGVGNDYLPLYITTKYGDEGVEDDDFLVKLDSGADILNDAAIGRLTVVTRREADNWAGRIVHYESNIDLGSWRDKVVLVADDEFSFHTSEDFCFLIDTERMTGKDGYIPGYFDIRKIYLHDYPFTGQLKNGARKDLLDEWNEGALLVNYMGHGGRGQLADEVVMGIPDVLSLHCGYREPLFLAFSCTVGDVESPFQRSMGQELVVHEGGGAIAAIVGVKGTYGLPNRMLNYALFDHLFTSIDSTGTLPVGYSLMLAKIETAPPFYRHNANYIYLGDPALMLASPALTVEQDISGCDTMYTGNRYRVEGNVIRGGQRDYTFNGTAEVIVEESSREIFDGVTFCYNVMEEIRYKLPGNVFFKGTATVTAGRFGADFVVPIRCRAGVGARVRSYVRASEVDGAGAVDTLRLIPSETVPNNEGPPDIDLYFAGQATRVKQGAILIASLSDPDGIATQGTGPQSSIFLEFDGSGYPVFVNEYFQYDQDSYTTGSVEYPLNPGISAGAHSVTVRAFDNLGESSSDTLRFEVIEEGLYTVTDVFNMPNPFTESTNFVFQLSNDADVCLRIYNLSGREIWQAKLSGREGFNSIYWNGSDLAGDRVANGTYLYLLDVSFTGSLNRRETVKGKVVMLH